MNWILLLPALVILALWTLSNFVGTLFGCETPLGFINILHEAGAASLAFNPDYREPFVFHFVNFAIDEDSNTLAGRFDFELESVSGPLWYASVKVPYSLLFGSYLVLTISFHKNREAQWLPSWRRRQNKPEHPSREGAESK